MGATRWPLVSPQPIYAGDRGAVLVGRRGPSGHHFDYYALEASTGAHRWHHARSDYHHLSATSEGASEGDGGDGAGGPTRTLPQIDYKLDLHAIGGGEAGIDGRHDGERPWRAFEGSLLALLPRTWRHPHDTSLELARFSKSRRRGHREQRARAAMTSALHASGAAALSLTAWAFGAGAALDASLPPSPPPAATTATAAAAAATAAATAAAAAATEPPNVLVAARRSGLEVLHLYTGRPLTHVPFADGSAAHGDVNGDGSIDHVSALSSDQTSRYQREAEAAEAAAAAAAAHAADDGEGEGGEGGEVEGGARKQRRKKHRGKKGGGGGAARKATCLALCSSGVPVHEVLWNASACAPPRRHANGRRPRGSAKPATGVASPLLVARRAEPLRGGGGRVEHDTLLLASDGSVTCVGADGTERWMSRTDAHWRVAAPSGLPANANLLPSLTLYAPPGGGMAAAADGALVVALGESSLCMLSLDRGAVLGCTSLPHAPVAPPVIADFTADGFADVIIPCAGAHLGVRVAPGSGALLRRLLLCFLGLAAALLVLLRLGEQLAAPDRPADAQQLHARGSRAAAHRGAHKAD